MDFLDERHRPLSQLCWGVVDQPRLHQRRRRGPRSGQHLGRQCCGRLCHDHEYGRHHGGDHQQQRPAGLHQRQQQLHRRHGHRAGHARCHGQRPERGQRRLWPRVERHPDRIDQRREHQRGHTSHRRGRGRGGTRHRDQRRRHRHAHCGRDQRDRHCNLLGQHLDEHQRDAHCRKRRRHDALLGRIERGGIARQGRCRHRDPHRREHLFGRHVGQRRHAARQHDEPAGQYHQQRLVGFQSIGQRHLREHDIRHRCAHEVRKWHGHPRRNKHLRRQHPRAGRHASSGQHGLGVGNGPSAGGQRQRVGRFGWRARGGLNRIHRL